MKRYFLLTLLLTSNILFAQNTPVAIVNLYKNEIITTKEFNLKVKSLETAYGKVLADAEKRQILSVLIADLIFSQEATKRGIKVSEDEVFQTIKTQFNMPNLSNTQIKEIVEKEGNNWNEFLSSMQRSIASQKLLLKEAEPKIANVKNPTNVEIQAFYEDNKSNFVNPDIVRVSHVYFAFKNDEDKNNVIKKSKEIYTKINSKELTFEEAVRNYSEDDTSKTRNGDLAFIGRGDNQIEKIFGKEFIRDLFKAKKGDTLLLNSNQGAHIVKITEKYSQRFLNLDDKISPASDILVKEAIANNIVSEQKNKILKDVQQDLYNRLLKQASVQILDSQLK